MIDTHRRGEKKRLTRLTCRLIKAWDYNFDGSIKERTGFLDCRSYVGLLSKDEGLLCHTTTGKLTSHVGSGVKSSAARTTNVVSTTQQKIPVQMIRVGIARNIKTYGAQPKRASALL